VEQFHARACLRSPLDPEIRFLLNHETPYTLEELLPVSTDCLNYDWDNELDGKKLCASRSPDVA
jgi:hypothetical protein